MNSDHSAETADRKEADSPADSRTPFARKFSVYGDFWARFQAHGVRACPFFIEPILLAVYTVLFFLFCPAARKAVIGNLAILFPDSPRVLLVVRAFRIFWSFANSLTDAARCREGENIIDWEVEGEEHFLNFTADGGGAIVLTAHMGNYDIAAPMFASRFGKKLHAVRAPERDPGRQEYMQKKFQAEANEDFEVRYNAGDRLLGVDLARALIQGEYVAIQGDRVLFDVSPLKMPLKDLPGFHMNIPKGPFVLALTSGAEMLPLFAVRLGRRRYRIVIMPAISCQRKGRDHDRSIEEAARQWVEVLLPVIRRYWFQWYVFEPAFFNAGGESCIAVESPDSEPEKQNSI